MYIQLGYLRGQVKLRNPEIVNNNDNLGSMMKHHRLKLDMTLEEGAEGICSISYLSKIENSLIKPSSKYLLLLEEKYNTNFQNSDSLHQEIMYQLIENIFYNTCELMDEVTFDEDNYQAKLNLLGYFVSQGLYDKVRMYHDELNPYIKNFNDLELGFYVYITSKLLSHEGRYKDAFSILHISNESIKNLFLNTLIDIEKVILATKMNHHPYITLYYDDLIDDLMDNEFYHMIHEVKFYYLAYLVQYINDLKLEDLMSKAKHLTPEQLIYLEAKHYYINMQYAKAFDLLKNQSYDNFGTYELTLMTLNKLGDKKRLKEKLSKHIQIDNKHLKVIHRYLTLKCQHKAEAEVLTDFISKEVLKQNDLPDDANQLSFWYEEGHLYFKKIGFYKDATTLVHLILRKMKDLTTIFD